MNLLKSIILISLLTITSARAEFNTGFKCVSTNNQGHIFSFFFKSYDSMEGFSLNFLQFTDEQEAKENRLENLLSPNELSKTSLFQYKSAPATLYMEWGEYGYALLKKSSKKNEYMKGFIYLDSKINKDKFYTHVTDTRISIKCMKL